MKNQIFPIKKPFLAIEKYDIELTNIKILDKNIVAPGGAQAPEGESFLLLFWNFADLEWNAESAKNFQTQFFIVYGSQHHFVTRKIGFRVIS